MGVSDGGAVQQSQSTGQAPFPLNRVVAFLGPFLAIVSGALATWLVEHIPGLHIDKATLASNITAGIVFLIGAGGTFVMHHKWLSGWQQWEKSVTDAAKTPAPDLVPSGQQDPAKLAESALQPSEPTTTSTRNLGADGGQTADGELPPAAVGTELADGELPPPTVDPGPGDGSGRVSVLPDGEQELGSVPDGGDVQDGGDGSLVSLPETAVKPDAPADELGVTNGELPSGAVDPGLANGELPPGAVDPALTNGELPPPTVDPGPPGTGDGSDQASVLPDGEQELGSVPEGGDVPDGGDASLTSPPETAAKPDTPTDELEPVEV